MAWKSLQLKETNWRWMVLSENSILMQPEKLPNDPLTLIHNTNSLIEESSIEAIYDVVMGYDSITVFFDSARFSADTIIKKLGGLSSLKPTKSVPVAHHIPVCYRGPDLEIVAKHVGLTPGEIVRLHTQTEYKVAMMGFLPGFVYLSGLPESLCCPRKISPRTKVEAGSVGIGGDQTGIYSFSSPGGWQIIGRTPSRFFDLQQVPPTQIKAGDTACFEPISLASFKSFL